MHVFDRPAPMGMLVRTPSGTKLADIPWMQTELGPNRTDLSEDAQQGQSGPPQQRKNKLRAVSVSM